MDALKKLYAIAPPFMQDVMVSVQGLLYNHRRISLPLARAHTAKLLETQWSDPEEFRRIQTRELRRLLTHAAAHVPYYRRLFREHGIDPSAVTPETIRAIPRLSKSRVRESPSDFLAGGRPQRSWNHLFTSGTTGAPLDLWSSRRSFSEIWSFVYRLRSWAGIPDPFRPRRVQFTGRDIAPDSEIRPGGRYWRRNAPGKALLMSTSHISAESAPGYLAAMLRFQPELMDGYPSAFAVMARLASSQGLKAPRPRAIITSAETLLPEDKLLIEQVFGCAVFDQYASSDTAAFMCSCEHGAMHVNPEFGLCEILDERGDPVPAGQEGEIVATSFCNTEQVFIRYRTGDTAIPAEGPCPCGRHMPAVAAITGRMDDILYTLERGYVGRLDPVFKGLSGIIEAQLIQENLGRIRVLTVPAPCVRPDYSALTANMRKKLGDKIDIVIEEVAVIPRGPNGKFRSVISKCRDEYPKS